MNTGLLRHAVATVLTVYGIETINGLSPLISFPEVATVLTVYGIETIITNRLNTSITLNECCNSAYRLRY